MTNKNTGVVLVVIIAIAILGLFFPRGNGGTVVERVVEKVVGGSSGPTHDNRQFFNAGATSGGRVATSSTAVTYTTVAGDFNGTPTYIDWTVNVNTTVSLSATSTFAYVPNIGDVAKVYIRNASTTATASLTFAAVNSGVDLQKNEDVADLALLGLDWAELTFIRESNNLVTVLYTEFTEGD